MSDYLIPLVEGEILKGTCIDGDNTSVHEDMIRITKNESRIQIDIASLAPPSLTPVLIEKLELSLKQQLETPWKKTLPFFDWHSRRDLGFNSKYSQLALIGTYVLTKYGELLSEDLSMSRAIGEMVYYSEYDVSKEAEEILSHLKILLKSQPGLLSSVEKGLQKKLPKSRSLGFQTTYIANEIFNKTCRNSARMIGSPFIQKSFSEYEDREYSLGGEWAKFTSPLRKPESFINATNLKNHFQKTRMRFPESRIRNIIPVR